MNLIVSFRQAVSQNGFSPTPFLLPQESKTITVVNKRIYLITFGFGKQK
jgi:hypothetical protein